MQQAWPLYPMLRYTTSIEITPPSLWTVRWQEHSEPLHSQVPEWQMKLPLLTWAWLCAWFTDDFLACPLREAERVNSADDTWTWVPPLPAYWLHDSCKPLNSSETHGEWTLHPRAGVGSIHLHSAWLTVVLHPWPFFFSFCFYLLHQNCLLIPRIVLTRHILFWNILDQWFSKSKGLTSSISMQILRSPSRPTESRNSASWIFKSPPGDSEACSSFRATVLKCRIK